MSNRKDKDSDQDISVNSVERILFDEETQENNESKVTKKKEKRLSTSPTQKTGSGSPGKTKKKPKIRITPPGATGFVRIKKDSGTLIIDNKAVALENKKLKNNEGILQDQILALRAELDKYKNTGSQPDSSPTKNLPISEGLEGFSKHQYDIMLTVIGEQMKMHQDAQAAAKRLELKKILDPSLDLEAPSHSRAASYPSGLAEKSCSKYSHKDVMGSTFHDGDGSGDELDITGDIIG